MRSLRKEEYNLIVALIKNKPNAEQIISQLQHIQVEEMNDGGMGSLRFITKNSKSRSFGSTLLETQLIDKDNIPISIAINLDKEGELYELDIWKVDFSPLKKFPIVK